MEKVILFNRNECLSFVGRCFKQYAKSTKPLGGLTSILVNAIKDVGLESLSTSLLLAIAEKYLEPENIPFETKMEKCYRCGSIEIFSVKNPVWDRHTEKVVYSDRQKCKNCGTTQ